MKKMQRQVHCSGICPFMRETLTKYLPGTRHCIRLRRYTNKGANSLQQKTKAYSGYLITKTGKSKLRPIVERYELKTNAPAVPGDHGRQIMS